MRVGEICNRLVSHVERSVSIVDAARRMREEHVGDLVVVERRGTETLPVGILTDRDVVVSILAKNSDHVRSLEVGDVIAGQVVTASEDEELPPVLKRMRKFGVRRIPVVNASGALTGILSIDDVICALADALAEVASILSRQTARETERRP
jgi:CBS domain-containing protein